MSVITRTTLTTDSNGVSPTGFSKSDAPTMFRKLSSLFGAVAGGGHNGRVLLAHAPIAATAKLTCTNTGTNGDTFVICNVSCSIVTSGATGNQVNVAASGAALATAIVALVNTSSSFSGIVSATNPSSGVVLLTAYLPGAIGNGLQLTESSTSITLTNQWGSLTAGSEGTAATYKVGL